MRPKLKQWWSGATVGIADLVSSKWSGNTVGTINSKPNCLWHPKIVAGADFPIMVTMGQRHQGWIDLRTGCVCSGLPDIRMPDRMFWWMDRLSACVEIAAKLGASTIVAPGFVPCEKLAAALSRAGIELVVVEKQDIALPSMYNVTDASSLEVRDANNPNL